MSKESTRLNLRRAVTNDCELMFRLQKLDGSPILEDTREEFKQYQQDFEADQIQVIESGGTPIGRLRVVRENDIYIGGIQILPLYRNMGIGTTILKNLVKEACATQKSIRLEVFKTNTQAIELYSRLGFKIVGETGVQRIMKYVPQ